MTILFLYLLVFTGSLLMCVYDKDPMETMVDVIQSTFILSTKLMIACLVVICVIKIGTQPWTN